MGQLIAVLWRHSTSIFTLTISTTQPLPPTNNERQRGNMRYRALQELKFKDAPCKVIPQSATVEQLKAYTLKDNSGFGQWDFDLLANEWDVELLDMCAIDVPFVDDVLDPDNLNDDFSLPDGDKGNVERITFILSNEEAEIIKGAIAQVVASGQCKNDILGNNNKNGNALYLIVKQWGDAKK